MDYLSPGCQAHYHSDLTCVHLAPMATAFLKTCLRATLDFGTLSAPLPFLQQPTITCSHRAQSATRASCSWETWRGSTYDDPRPVRRQRAAPLPRSAYADDHRRSDMPKSLILLYRGQCGDCGVRAAWTAGRRTPAHARNAEKMPRKRETPAKGH